MSVSINGTGGITFADASTQSTGGYTGFRNRIINGAMMIDQRNAHGAFTVGTNATAYEADRWFIYSSGGQTLGNTNADSSLSGFSYSMTLVPQTGATGVTLNQRIESYNIADCVGQNVTLSFWIYTSGLSGTSSYVQPYTPTAQDNYSSSTFGNSQTISYTNGSWVKNIFTFSTSNSSMNASYGLALSFNFASAVGATIKITGVQLEKGSVATPFEFRPYGTELALCQRYYAKLGAFGTSVAFGSGYVNTATLATYYIKYPVQMRATPTANYNAVSCDGSGWGPAVTSISGMRGGTDSCELVLVASGGGMTAGQGSVLISGSSSGYVDFAAEL